MPIDREWFVDYQNQLIVHATHWVYYDTYVQGPGSADFQAGETLTFDTGGTPYTAILVHVDLTNTRLTVVHLSDPSALTDGHTITGGTSGATAAINVDFGEMQTTTIPYDNLASGTFAIGDEVTIGGTESAYVVSDDGSSEMQVVYLTNPVSNNDQISNGSVTADVNATSFVVTKTTYTVRALYSFLQDTFDELGQMDDTVPMSAQTPTEFTMINGWFIDDESTKYLSGGAIQSSGWNDEIDILTLDGSYTNAVTTDIGKTVLDDAVAHGTLLHYNNTEQKWWIRRTAVSAVVDNSTMTISSGTGAGTAAGNSDSGETLYANIYTLGTIQTTPSPKTYVFQNGLALSEWWGRGDSEAHIDVLIKVKEYDEEIDGAQITVFVRHFADLYDHFNIDLSSGGRNAVPLATQADLNNNTTGEATLTVASSAGFTVGNFVRGGTSQVYAEVLAVDTGVLTVGNIVAEPDATAPANPRAFSNGETLSATIDGTANGDTGTTTTLNAVQTNVVTDYNDIGIYFVNLIVPFNSGSDEPSLGDRIDGVTSNATAYYVGSTISSGSWATNDAAGNMYLANWVDTTNFNASETLENITTADTDIASTNGAQSIQKTFDKAFEQGTAYPYNIIVDCAGRTMAQVYEWFKYVTREDANSTQTNYIVMYRVNDAGDAIIEEDGEEYISAQTTYTPVKASPFGTFAGGKLFAARGVWVENMDTADRQNFQLIDSNNNTRVPPNFITITVNSVVSGDKVTVFRTSSGATINKSQFTAGYLTVGDNETSDTAFVVQETIPSDTPTSGYIRVVDTGDTSINRESRYAYSSWSGTTFTLSSGQTLDRTYSAGVDTAYVPYYDEVAYDTSVSVTVIYNASQTVLTRVRQYDNTTPTNSILPFQITGTVTTSGYTVAAIRTPDTIVTTY